MGNRAVLTLLVVVLLLLYLVDPAAATPPRTTTSVPMHVITLKPEKQAAGSPCDRATIFKVVVQYNNGKGKYVEECTYKGDNRARSVLGTVLNMSCTGPHEHDKHNDHSIQYNSYSNYHGKWSGWKTSTVLGNPQALIIDASCNLFVSTK